jgi:hypothetical protein
MFPGTVGGEVRAPFIWNHSSSLVSAGTFREKNTVWSEAIFNVLVNQLAS